jgi:putative membrane protein
MKRILLATSMMALALTACGQPTTETAAMDERHTGMLDELTKATPEQFDAKYLDQQTQAHREALGLMDSYATHGDNAALKTLAAETKPKIQMHLDMVSKLDHGGADDAAKDGATNTM